MQPVEALPLESPHRSLTTACGGDVRGRLVLTLRDDHEHDEFQPATPEDPFHDEHHQRLRGPLSGGGGAHRRAGRTGHAGHLRGKRIPIGRFFDTPVRTGANIADAMFVFDMQNDLADNPYMNMDSGFLDCKLVPDVSTGAVLGASPRLRHRHRRRPRSERQSPIPFGPPKRAGGPDRAMSGPSAWTRWWPPSWSSISAPPTGSRSSTHSSTAR